MLKKKLFRWMEMLGAESASVFVAVMDSRSALCGLLSLLFLLVSGSGLRRGRVQGAAANAETQVGGMVLALGR